MSWASEQTALEAKFATWTATPIKWSNKAFSQPTTPWIAVHILNGTTLEASVSPPVLRRNIGVLVVQIFAKENAGDAQIRAYADQLQSLFINVPNSEIVLSSTETIRFGPPALSGLQLLNGWAQRNLSIPFERDHFL